MSIKKHAVVQTGLCLLNDANDEPMYADGPDGNPDKTRRMAIRMYGPGSKEYIEAQSISNNRQLDRLRKKGKTDMTAEQKLKEIVTLVTACTHSFENIDYEDADGNPLRGTALYKAVYADPELGFVIEQANKFINEWSNFTKASTTTL